MNISHHFALFDTSIGRCGVVWSARGLCALQLPETNDTRTRERLLRQHPGAALAEPPPEVRQSLQAISAVLNGARDDLRQVPIDLGDTPAFQRRVYELARQIPPGRTRSYGELAQDLGEPGAARAVGQALGHNPLAIVVPCHRVLAAGARPGGFSANGGVATKLRLLEIEGARFGNTPGLFDGRD